MSVGAQNLLTNELVVLFAVFSFVIYRHTKANNISRQVVQKVCLVLERLDTLRSLVGCIDAKVVQVQKARSQVFNIGVYHFKQGLLVGREVPHVNNRAQTTVGLQFFCCKIVDVTSTTFIKVLSFLNLVRFFQQWSCLAYHL